MFSEKLRTPRALAILTGAIAILAFVPSVGGEWIYDDWKLIANNPYVHSLDHWPRWFVEDFWNVSEEMVRFGTRIVYWRPLVSTTYAVDWQIGGGSSVWFHVVNLALHAIVAVLAFVVLRRWLGGATLPAFAAATLFAVHPTKAESVAWIAGRTDVMCTLAILVACQGMARRLAGKRGGIALEVFATLVAYGSKEQAIVLPVFAAIEAWVARGRPALEPRVIWQMVRAAIPQLLVAVTYLALRGAFMPLRAVDLESKLAVGDHLLIILESVGRYVALVVAPYELSIQQGLVGVADGKLAFSMPHVVIGAVSLVVLAGAAIALRKRWPAITLGIAFFLATLSPTANIVYTEMQTLISERFLYLPMFGLAFAAGFAIDRCTGRWCAAAAAAVIAACCAQAMNRSADYQDGTEFWAREREIHPDSREARYFFMAKAMTDKRYADAMNEILVIAKHPLNEPAVVATQLVEVLVGLIPDRDRDGLARIDGFARDLIESKPPAATIDIRELHYSVPTQTKRFTKAIPKMRVVLRSLRADIASRLGDDARALELIGEALRECPRCLKTVSIAVFVYARAGRYDEAEDFIDVIATLTDQGIAKLREVIGKARDARDRALGATGPAQLQARASELAGLDAYGRAFEILAPHKDDLKRAPKAVLGFAELAVRAGEPAVAREVLVGHLSPPEIEERIAQWSRAMGWQ